METVVGPPDPVPWSHRIPYQEAGVVQSGGSSYFVLRCSSVDSH